MLQKRGLVWLSRPASASWVCACAESGVLRGGGGVSEAPGTYCPLGFWGCRLVGERKGHIPPPFFFCLQRLYQNDLGMSCVAFDMVINSTHLSKKAQFGYDHTVYRSYEFL